MVWEYTLLVVSLLTLIVVVKLFFIFKDWDAFKQRVQDNLNMIRVKQELELKRKNEKL